MVTDSTHPSSKSRAILLVTHEHSTGDASLRYRTFSHAESLSYLGVSCDAVRYGHDGLLESIPSYRALVLHRVPWADAEPLVERAREAGVRVITDTDDLVFDALASQHVEAIAGMSAEWRKAWSEGFRRTMAEGTGAIVATEELRQHALPLASPVEVLPNVVSEEMIALAERAREPHVLERRNRSDDEGAALAYLSGSPTHAADFDEVAASVLWALETFPQVRFVVVGPLDLSDDFGAYRSRIERIPFVPWRELPQVLRQVDVNLAPIADNAFSTAKSAGKYLEAALLEVPTVASRRGDFVRVIEQGRNGALASTHDEWCDAIGRLVTDSLLRRELGRQARADVLRNHTTLVRTAAIHAAWCNLTRSSEATDPLAVDWLVGDALPDVSRECISALTQALVERGHHVSTHGPADRLPAVDARIATDTETAYALARDESSLFRLRLVQRAGERGFELPLRALSLGGSLGVRVREASGRATDVLEPAVDLGEQFDRLLRRACFLRLPRSGDRG